MAVDKRRGGKPGGPVTGFALRLVFVFFSLLTAMLCFWLDYFQTQLTVRAREDIIMVCVCGRLGVWNMAIQTSIGGVSSVVLATGNSGA